MVEEINPVRESSFNMIRGDEDIEGGLRKFLDTQKGGSEKISSFEFQYLHPPPPFDILNELPSLPKKNISHVVNF